MKNKCLTCHHWDWLGSECNIGQEIGQGLCRRYPPQHNGTTEDQNIYPHDRWGQPVTLQVEWCGEWSPVNSESTNRPPEDPDKYQARIFKMTKKKWIELGLLAALYLCGVFSGFGVAVHLLK
jgi:hypothetical protein